VDQRSQYTLRVRFLTRANLSKGRDAKLPVFGFWQVYLIKTMTAEPPEVGCLENEAPGTRKRRRIFTSCLHGAYQRCQRFLCFG